MKAEEKTVALYSFQLLCSLYIHWGEKIETKKKKNNKKNLGVGRGGGEGQEQRDRRAKF